MGVPPGKGKELTADGGAGAFEEAIEVERGSSPQKLASFTLVYHPACTDQ